MKLQSQLLALRKAGSIALGNRCVVLDEGQMTQEDMRFLECLAEEVHCPCEAWYKRMG